MKTLFAAAALVALVANPVLAQTAVDAVTSAAKEAAVQATTDGISKAAGGKTSEKDVKAKGKHDKDGHDMGKSDSHRQDGDHGHKGKKKGHD